jgi:hypothetical protein
MVDGNDNDGNDDDGNDGDRNDGDRNDGDEIPSSRTKDLSKMEWRGGERRGEEHVSYLPVDRTIGMLGRCGQRKSLRD